MTSVLGRGLSSLLGPDVTEQASLQFLPIRNLVPNPSQPRHQFDGQSLEELSASIKENGVLQPIIVRQDPKDPTKYQIVAGERRWRAAEKAQLESIPSLVCLLDDKQSLGYALIENVQREDLNCMEEAEAYARLMRDFAYTQESLSRAIGKSRSHIANILRLLNLPDSVKGHVRTGSLSFGHARALVGRQNAEELAQDIIHKGLTVRQAEKISTFPKESALDEEATSEAMFLAEQLTHALGTRVRVHLRHEGGMLQIYFRDLQGLQRLIDKLS
jgi:ParB family chromosome partitioning protein